MEIAVLQFEYKKTKNNQKDNPYEVVDTQLDRLVKLRSGKLANTDLVVFHDDWLVSDRGTTPNMDSILTFPNEISEKICKIAVKLKLYIAFRMWERGDKGHCQLKGQASDYQIYDIGAITDPEGNIILKQRRTHLLRGYSRGDKFNVVDTPIGNIGILICSELLLPETMRMLCIQGAQIIVWFHGMQKTLGAPKFIINNNLTKEFAVTEWSDISEDICKAIYWSATPDLKKLAYTRVYENHCCLVGAHSVGNVLHNNHKLPSGGRSLIAAPNEKLVLASKRREQVLVKVIDIDAIARFQRYILAERQPQLYSENSKKREEKNTIAISDLLLIQEKKS